jgi:pyridoxamine 5'-phosphate oxidase family protein
VSTFIKAEREYLQSQQMGRLATVSPHGEPQVKAVGFQYNAELDTIDIAGMGMEKSQKFRNVTSNPNVSFLVDDILSDSRLWTATCLERLHCPAPPGQGVSM